MDHLLLLLLWSSGLGGEGSLTSAAAQCEAAKADIVILVDESWSMSLTNFMTSQEAVGELISTINIGPDAVQIGLTLFGDTPRIMWHLNTYQTEQSLLKAVDSLRPAGGDPHTGLALKHVLRCSFKPSMGMRPDSRKILVVFTDVNSKDDVELPAAHLKDTGIEVYVIGFKGVSGCQLLTDDAHCMHIEDFSSLQEIVNNIANSLCDSATSQDSVRLVNGPSLCSGRLEVRFNQPNQGWSSVCEADFDLQDAEVVCRELGCGAPPVLQGALYGEMKVPWWTKEFQCGGHESALKDCRSSDTNTCSPGRAAGLTCSEPVRLVGGASRCAGALQVKLKEWRMVYSYDWSLKTAAAVCRQLDCGSAVYVGITGGSSESSSESSSDSRVWLISSDCIHAGYSLKDCASADSSSAILSITCSDSVRLVDGPSLCSGRLEVKSNQPNRGWSSVCEAGFDLQDAEVVCRELGCGAPSVLQGALYGEKKVPWWTKEFQCGGHESALKDCRNSASDRNTCSPGRAAGLTCSEPVRLVGGASRCAGALQVKLGEEWRMVYGYDWSLKEAAAVCRELDCGSAFFTRISNESSESSVWRIDSDCVQDGRRLRECSRSSWSSSTVEVICSDLLEQPIISASSVGGVSRAQQQGFRVFRGSSFTLSCSVRPQYPGGSFQLSFTSSSTTLNHTQPAVSHSAHFLFPAADLPHRGSYSCLYHVHVFSHNVSSESRRLSVVVLDPTVFFLRLLLLLLSLLLFTSLICYSHKIAREQKKKKKKTRSRKAMKEEQLAVCRAGEDEAGSSK